MTQFREEHESKEMRNESSSIESTNSNFYENVLIQLLYIEWKWKCEEIIKLKKIVDRSIIDAPVLVRYSERR